MKMISAIKEGAETGFCDKGRCGNWFLLINQPIFYYNSLYVYHYIHVNSRHSNHINNTNLIYIYYVFIETNI